MPKKTVQHWLLRTLLNSVRKKRRRAEGSLSLCYPHRLACDHFCVFLPLFQIQTRFLYGCICGRGAGTTLLNCVCGHLHAQMHARTHVHTHVHTHTDRAQHTAHKQTHRQSYTHLNAPTHSQGRCRPGPRFRASQRPSLSLKLRPPRPQRRKLAAALLKPRPPLQSRQVHTLFLCVFKCVCVCVWLGVYVTVWV